MTAEAAPRERARTSAAWPAILAAALRAAIGPLALAGFFLPWTHGVGPLAGSEFSGFRLVGFAGRLQALDLTPSQGGVLWSARLLMLGVAIAGAWLTLLAHGHRRHIAYRASGWYLVAWAAALLAFGAFRAGLTVPPLGLVLLALGAALFATLELGRLRR
jgi:hypothetical protein